MKKRNGFVIFGRIVLFVLFTVVVIAGAAGVTAYYTVDYFKNMSAYQYEINLPDGIDVIEPVEIGGIEQWISIRGHDSNAPVLLYLHGGPGFDAIRFSYGFTGPWEEYFTVVVWDQRGAGMSYYPTEQIGDTMTVETMLSDTEEMIQYLRKRFDTEKIFVMGHSWGSILGIHMAKKHPDWLYAYIGLGQVVNSAKSREHSYAHVMELLEKEGDEEGIARLKELAPFPSMDMPVTEYYKAWGVLQKYLIKFGIGDWHQKDDPMKYKLLMLSILLKSHTVSLPEIHRSVFSDDRPTSLPSLKEGVRNTDIPNQVGTEFDVPVFLVLGRHDWQVYHQLAIDYFNELTAPQKEMLILENSAHLMVIEEPGRILDFLVNEVLPTAMNNISLHPVEARASETVSNE